MVVIECIHVSMHKTTLLKWVCIIIYKLILLNFFLTCNHITAQSKEVAEEIILPLLDFQS